MSTDIIILMTTDANLPKFPWGFDESAVYALKNLDEYLAMLNLKRPLIKPRFDDLFLMQKVF